MLDSTRLAEKRSRAPWMEALKTEQEAYGCINKALLEGISDLSYLGKGVMLHGWRP